MREPRSAVMILVEVSWQENGTWQVTPARMEDKSASGACIRFKKSIAVGSKLRIKSRFEQFSGTVKYCRTEGWDFLVGLQKDNSSAATDPLPVDNPDDTSPQIVAKALDPEISTSKIPGPPPPQQEEDDSDGLTKAPPDSRSKIQSEPIMRARPTMPSRAARHAAGRRDRSHISRPQEFGVLRQTEIRTSRANPTEAAPDKNEDIDMNKDKDIEKDINAETGKDLKIDRDVDIEKNKEKKPVKRKWLELAPWHHKPEALSIAAESGKLNGSSNRNDKRAPDTHPPRASAFTNPDADADTPRFPLHAAEAKAPSFQAELLPMEDICSAAAISNPRRGYGVNKVIDMLRSEHIRGLSPDLKRAAILMALDIAGVSIGQIQQDAKARQAVLDSYEAEQQKQLEAEWTRREEENNRIQADMERVQAQFTARITRNLDGIASEKAAFNNWQATKKQTTDSMSEAVELCLKSASIEATPAAPATPSITPPDGLANAAAAGAKL
jgi:hypothetical protein